MLRSTPARRLASGLFFCLALLGGCATPLTQALRESPPAGPRQVELEQTPYFPQIDYYCGPAALATVLQAAGGRQTPAELVPQVYLPGRQGSLQVELLAAARRQGLLATVIPGRFDALVEEIRAGNPVLVLQNLGLSIAPSWHYAVVVGYDLDAGDAGEFILRSGPERRMRMGSKVFERTWARAEFWAMVVTPPDRLPASATPREQARALAALERLDPPAATRGYRAAIARWPAESMFRVGLANALYNTGRLEEAADTLFALLQAEPDNAAALNNLANLRLRLGDLVSARRFAERAVLHPGPWQAAARKTLDEIERAERAESPERAPPAPATPPPEAR
jgi:tetratricopeptide (TPR) repeat protein